MKLDEFLQDASMIIHDLWTQYGGNELGDYELQQLNDTLGAFFSDKCESEAELPGLSNAQINFFCAEIENEENGGVYPANLNSAIDSLNQAPEDVIIELCDDPVVHDKYSVQEFVESIESLRIHFNGNMKLMLFPEVNEAMNQ